MKKLVSVLTFASVASLSLAGCVIIPGRLNTQDSGQPELSPAQMTPGQKFLKVRLAELESIQRQPAFKEQGLSPDGPFAGWIDKLRSDAKKIDPAPGGTLQKGVDLLERLAFEYVSWVSFDGAKQCGQLFSVVTVYVGESCHIKKSIEDKTVQIRQLINKHELAK